MPPASVAASSSLGASNYSSVSRSTDAELASVESSVFQRYKPAIFKLLSVFAKEKNDVNVASVFVFAEFLQLLAFAFLGPWGSVGKTTGSILLWTQIQNRVMQYGVAEVDIIMMIISLLLIFCTITLCCYNVLCLNKSEFAAGLTALRSVKLLVWLVSGLFFLPVITPLLRGLNTEIFPNDDALKWISFALSLLGVFIFLPFTMVISLTMFNSNFKSRSYLGRANGVIGFLEICIKFMLASIFIFANEKPTSLAVVGLICHLVIAAYIYVFLPYFNSRLNVYKFALVSALAWSSLIQLIVSCLKDEKDGLYLYIVWAIGTPLVAVGGWFLLRYRNHNAVYGHYQLLRAQLNGSSESEQSNPEFIYRYYVKFFHSKRFFSPQMVELHTRWLHRHHSITDLAVARAIFDRGIDIFPNSPNMRILAGIFSGLWFGQSSQWKLNLTKASSMNPNFVTQFVLYQQFYELRTLAEAKRNLNIADSLELQQELRTCKKIHRQATAEIIHFWKLLSCTKVDVNRVQHTVSKITTLEQLGTTIFERLRMHYPKDPRVLNAFARFQDDVAGNYRKADLLYALAAANEHEGEINVDLNAAMNNHIMMASSRPQNPIVAANDNDDNASIGGSSTTATGIRRSGITRREIRNYMEYRQMVLSLRPSSTRWSTLTIAFVAVLFIGLAIGEAVWVSKTVRLVANNIEQIKRSGFRREKSVETAMRQRTMQFLMTGENGYSKNLPEYNRLAQETLDLVPELYDLQKELFFSQSEDSPSYKMWLDRTWSIFNNITVFRGKDVFDLLNQTGKNYILAWQNNGLNEWDASSEMWRHMAGAATMDTSLYINGDYKFNSHFRFIMDNFPYIYAEGFNNATSQMVSEAETTMSNVLEAILYAFAGILAILFLVGIGIFRPMLNRMVKSRKQSIDTVARIPKEICAKIYARMQASSLHNSVGSHMQEKDDDDDEDDDIPNPSSGKVASIKVMYTKLTMTYIFGLILISSFFGISIGVNYALAANLKEWGRRIDLTRRIPFLTNRIAYQLRELTYLDDFMYLSQSNPRYNIAHYGTKGSYQHYLLDQLDADFAEFNDIQLTLLFGKEERRIHEGRLPQVLEQPMFTQFWQFNGSNASTDQLVNTFMEDTLGLRLLSEHGNFTSSNPYFIESQAVYRMIMEGFGLAAQVNESLFNHACHVLNASAQGLMALIIVGVLCIYQFIFRNLISYLKKATVESTKMLLLIPPEASRRDWALQVMLRGLEGAVLFFQEQGLEIPKAQPEKITKMRLQSIGNPIIKKSAVKENIDEPRKGSGPGGVGIAGHASIQNAQIYSEIREPTEQKDPILEAFSIEETRICVGDDVETRAVDQEKSVTTHASKLSFADSIDH